MPFEARILAIVRYVRDLDSVDDLDAIAEDIFR